MKNVPRSGFTLIELMVVIAIIGLLASIIMVALSSGNTKARNATRLANISDIQAALETYFAQNGAYPSTGGTWRSTCSNWGGYTADQVIPGLAPAVMTSIPTDPLSDNPTNHNCYLYKSNGTDYKLLDHNLTETDVTIKPEFIDPRRNSAYWNGSSPCTTVGNATTWAAWSSDASQCW